LSAGTPAGAWGEQAGEMLARAAPTHTVHRAGGLAMLEPPHLLAGGWQCWLYGAPEDRGGLAADFGLEPGGDLPGAFSRALAPLGEAACELLCGRFVVVAFERERNRCVVTRDQLGAQPLVYARAADGVVFAEHERDLLGVLAGAPGPDRLALLQWIETSLTPVGRTLYEGMRRLPAGHRLTLDPTRVSMERWWSIRYAGIERGSDMELGERLRVAAFAAIGRAAAGAARPAVKLSGGLDSACVAAGMGAAGLADRALALGGTFATHPEADERELIEATARTTKMPLELVAYDPAGSMLAPALAHIERWRVPPGSPNLFLWQPLTTRARALGVDVMLDGEGGDEVFGVAMYLIADMLRAGRPGSAWALTAGIPGIGRAPSRRTRMRVLRHYGLAVLSPAGVRRRREARARGRGAAGALLPPADAQALAELRDADEARDRREGPFWWRFQAKGMIDLRDQFDVGAHFRREALDQRIERRHPLLHDLRLIETALAIPPRTQFDPVRDRPLLRDALRGWIPETVRTRHTKSHFSSLVLAGMRAEEADLIEPLRRADAPVRAYVASAALDRRLAVPAQRRPLLQAGPLWRAAIANLWLLALAGERPTFSIPSFFRP
jgi:asparagine synthase (glutamine-hydrolysing)